MFNSLFQLLFGKTKLVVSNDPIKMDKIHRKNYNDFIKDGIESWGSYGIRLGFLCDQKDVAEWVNETVNYLASKEEYDKAINLRDLLKEYKLKHDVA